MLPEPKSPTRHEEGAASGGFAQGAPRAPAPKAREPVAREKGRTFGDVIRERRRQLDLTQEEVARQIKTSIPYVGHLEANKRHASESIVVRLADVLGLDGRELFFLANPAARALLEESHRNGHSSWEEFRKDERLLRAFGVTALELEMLSHVALMGEVRSVRDFVYILNTVRQALAR
jgi:transcriptional regulator with XRE-family HTH domain